MAKTASKMWLAKFAAMFTHRTRLACNNARYTDKTTSLLLIQEKPKIWQKQFKKPQCSRPRHLQHVGFFPNCLKLLNSTPDIDDDVELFFTELMTNQWDLTLFPAKTIVRDSHHSKSPTPHEQDLDLY